MSYFSRDSLRKVKEDPSLVIQTLRRGCMRINGEVYDRFMREEGKTAVMEEDWDTLVLLDGCRYDAFCRRTIFDGELQYRLSLGSSSEQFIERNFLRGDEYHDTIYVTANPYVHTIDENVFFDVIDLINDDSAWDTDHKTVLPSTVTDTAKRIHANHPDKRIIVHYMQPHFPFVGSKSEGLEYNTGIYGRREKREPDAHIWNRYQSTIGADVDGIWAAYEENLDIVLRSVRELLTGIDGRIVLSADHGNLVGDTMYPIPIRGYGHPNGIHVPELIQVPWQIIENGERRSTTAEEPNAYERDEPHVERLRDLGYVD